MPKIHANGVQLYYETRGAGEPLVLIPGFSNGMWIWDWNAAALAERFRVITFDPRGVARSEAGAEALSIKLIADDVAALLNALGVEQAHILGASFGGFVAQEFALGYPAMTRSLILCCTSFGGPNHVIPPVETLAAMASTKGLNTEDRVRENLLLAFSPAYLHEHPQEIERVCALRAANVVPESVYLQQLQAAMQFCAEDRLANIAAPTLIVTGDADTIVPPQNSRNLAAKMPRAKLVTVSGGSHTFFIEQADEFNNIVTEFISRQQTAGSGQ
jgi:pimeloyl-ACP methyl ester carboxylesterase